MLSGMLREALERSPARVALETAHARTTYRQLWDVVRELARGLADRGVAPGARLYFVTDDPIEYAACFLAAACVRAVTVAGAGTAAGTERSALERSGAELAVLPARRTAARRHRAVRLGIPVLRMAGGRESRPPRHAAVAARETGAVVAELVPGWPGCVLRTQQNLVHEAEAFVTATGLRATDRIVCTLAIDRSPGLCAGLIAALRAQATVALCRCDRAATLAAALARHEPTVLITDARTLRSELLAGRAATAGLEALRVVLCARSDGAQLAPEARARFSGRLATFYHRPDAGVVALNTRGGADDCVGRPLPGVTVFLEESWAADPAATRPTWSFGSFVRLHRFPRALAGDSRRVNEPGVPGRIVVESPAAAAQAARDGRVHTGEHGYFDSDGALHILPAADAGAPLRRSA